MSADVEEAAAAPARTIPGLGPPALHTGAAAAMVPLDQVLSGMVAAGQSIEAICLYLDLTRAALDEHLVRLDLPIPPDRPLRSSKRFWAVVDIMRLIAWRHGCVHPETIGARLGRSANAVRAKARRLGIPAPDRRSLRRLDPATLSEPCCGIGAGAPQTSPADLHGQAAHGASIANGTPDPGAAAAQRVFPDLHQNDSPFPAPTLSLARSTGRLHEPTATDAGQCNLPWTRFIRPVEVATKAVPAASNASTLVPVAPPASEHDVQLCGDLSWIGSLKRPLQYRAVVWTLGMLYFGGLPNRAIAERIGKTEAAVRTLRTRCGVPKDYDRKKFSAVFDEVAARATVDSAGLELGFDDVQREYFWRFRRDRANVRQNRKRRRALGLVENYVTDTVTRVASATRDVSAPFATPPAMLGAG